MSDTNSFNATKNCDLAKTTAFKVEKLALLRIVWPIRCMQ